MVGVVVVLRVHDLDDVAVVALKPATRDDDAGQDEDEKDGQEKDEENLEKQQGALEDVNRVLWRAPTDSTEKKWHLHH